MQHEDFVRAGNQAADPSLYDVENAAMDRDGVLWSAVCRHAPWSERVLLDLGCGAGFWDREGESRFRRAPATTGRLRGRRARQVCLLLPAP